MAKAKTQQETVTVSISIQDVVDVAAMHTLAAVAGRSWQDWYTSRVRRSVREAFERYGLNVEPEVLNVGSLDGLWKGNKSYEMTDGTWIDEVWYARLYAGVRVRLGRDDFADSVYRSGAVANAVGSLYVGTDMLERWTRARMAEQARRDQREGARHWRDYADRTSVSVVVD